LAELGKKRTIRFAMNETNTNKKKPATNEGSGQGREDRATGETFVSAFDAAQMALHGDQVIAGLHSAPRHINERPAELVGPVLIGNPDPSHIRAQFLASDPGQPLDVGAYFSRDTLSLPAGDGCLLAAKQFSELGLASCLVAGPIKRS
jgi:hypothetical protein